ncbi:hypothetical protein [Streptomyces murinus]|uniref:hypothetical protein n=1 Tax=Streptomyces murinus TaxID=33900 RepID=UPI003D67A7B2
MAEVSDGLGCGFCGKAVVQHDGNGGRPRDYCDDDCRRRAQRKRDAERRVALPQFTHRLIAAELVFRAEQLLAACFEEAPLGEILDLAARIADDVDCLAAAVVADERTAGSSWAEVAVAARTSEGSARARWGGVQGARRLESREPMPWADRAYGVPRHATAAATGSAQGAQRSAAALARALHMLHERSDAGLGEVAGEVGIPLPVVHGVLEGEVLAPWPVTFMLAHLLGGQPGDLRLMWESAAKPHAHQSRSMPSAASLGAGLRGARLAAGCPAAADICPPGLNEAEAEAVFAGRLVPSWDVLRELLARLDADPEPFAGVWAVCISARDGGRFR